MSLPVDSKKDRFALLKSDEYLNKSPRSQLKTLANSAEFADDVGFMVDGNRLPLANAVSPKLKSQLDKWKIAVSPNKPWDEFYREARSQLEELKELHRDEINQEETEILKKPFSRKHSLTMLAQSIKTTQIARKSGITFKKDASGHGDAIKCYKEDKFLAVLKSVNGDPGAIDNPNSICHPLPHNFAKPCRNYKSAQKEALAYDLAEALGLAHTIPPTILALIENKNFHSYFDNKSVREFLEECPEHKEAIEAKLGVPSKERLCSLQRAVSNEGTLLEFKKTKKTINQKSFEDVILITRILWETDGHENNFLVKKIGDEYFLVKIDSGFSFPRINAAAMNSLVDLENSLENISDLYKEKTSRINLETLKKIARKYHLDDDCIEAAVERVEFMKMLIKVTPKITHREFELRLRMFSGYKLENEIRNAFDLDKGDPITKENKTQFALGIYSKKEIQNYERRILFGKEALQDDSPNQSDEEGYIFQFDVESASDD